MPTVNITIAPLAFISSTCQVIAPVESQKQQTPILCLLMVIMRVKDGWYLIYLSHYHMSDGPWVSIMGEGTDEMGWVPTWDIIPPQEAPDYQAHRQPCRAILKTAGWRGSNPWEHWNTLETCVQSRKNQEYICRLFKKCVYLAGMSWCAHADHKHINTFPFWMVNGCLPEPLECSSATRGALSLYPGHPWPLNSPATAGGEVCLAGRQPSGPAPVDRPSKVQCHVPADGQMFWIWWLLCKCAVEGKLSLPEDWLIYQDRCCLITFFYFILNSSYHFTILPLRKMGLEEESIPLPNRCESCLAFQRAWECKPHFAGEETEAGKDFLHLFALQCIHVGCSVWKVCSRQGISSYNRATQRHGGRVPWNWNVRHIILKDTHEGTITYNLQPDYTSQFQQCKKQPV